MSKETEYTVNAAGFTASRALPETNELLNERKPLPAGATPWDKPKPTGDANDSSTWAILED